MNFNNRSNRLARSLLAIVLTLTGCGAFAFGIEIRGGQPAGEYAPGKVARYWRAYSSMWVGPRIAFCIEPGAPLHPGTYDYQWTDTAYSPYFADAAYLPRAFVQAQVHLLDEGKPTALKKGWPIMTWTFRHPVWQDMLVVDVVADTSDSDQGTVINDRPIAHTLSVLSSLTLLATFLPGVLALPYVGARNDSPV